jgi:hypothetical protein
MTDCAGFGFNRIIPMRLFKRFRSFVMTGEAEGNLRFFEKIFFAGTVREMACNATFALDGLMYHLLFIVFTAMALITDLAALRFQKVTCLGCVRVVALSAVPSFKRCMQMGFIDPYLLFFMA